MGSVILAPYDDDEQDVLQPDLVSSGMNHMIIPFQNEYLYAAWTDIRGAKIGELVCTVPDLISILGHDGEAIGSQELRYGLRVSVVAFSSHPLWKTEKGLNVGGPSGFGLDLPFTGVGEYSPAKSVIDEFGREV